MGHALSTWLRIRRAILAGTAVALNTPATADVRILKSDVPELEKGTVLDDDAVLDVPEKKSVKVLLLPSKVTKSITGPYKGTANNYAPPSLPKTAKPPEAFDTGTFIGSPPPRSDMPRRK